MTLQVQVSLLGADCPVDHSRGAEPSPKSHADHSHLRRRLPAERIHTP